MRLSKLIQSEPYHILFNDSLGLLLKHRAKFFDAGFAITTIPDQSGGPIKTMRLFPIEIVHQNFIGEFFNKQPFSPRYR